MFRYLLLIYNMEEGTNERIVGLMRVLVSIAMWGSFLRQGGCSSGRCSVRVSYFVSQVVVDIECSTSIVRVCGGVNEGVSIE